MSRKSMVNLLEASGRVKGFSRRYSSFEMNSFCGNCVFFTCFAVFTTFFGKLVLHLDINKRSYNHVPGECGIIPNLPGILSLTTSTGGRLYMTTNSKNGISDNTHIFTFYPDNRTAREIEIRGAPPQRRTKPGPMSVAVDSNNPNIFVFNRQTGNVDVFGTNELSDVWEYRKSLKTEKFSGISALSASGTNSFYYVKSGVWSDNFALNILERTFSFPSGEVGFAKGKVVQHLTYLSSPSGIIYDSLKKTIFVTSFSRESLYVLKMKKNNIIASSKDYNIGCSPTSIWEDFDGSFLITCQPVRFRYLLHVFDVTSSAPSMVLRVVVPVNNETELSITQLYSNDGATISLANVTVRAGRSLLISNGNKILNCHL
ncbi:Protein CBG07381 [Caenorhabditis briggsae]|uniref:Protein CBG07381 n=1 Tax=Caenorhabditis briggsae TaxID=6238 RepID=A8X4W4_CAEBR|nr:Protein CBG07381 [Caenorhabditis briggsae]CAP27674.2 Protein CBG07381 [Caenorhabditis briggsae]